MLIALQLVSTPQGPANDEPVRRFDDAHVTIGRAPNCHVVLPDDLRIVSRQHARLTRHNGGLLLSCLSASAPVQVNGASVPHGGGLPVHDGDTIRIGGFELRLNLQAESTPARAAPEPAPRGVHGVPAGAEVEAAVQPALPAAARVAARRGRARLDEWFDLEPAAPGAAPPLELPAAPAEIGDVDLDLRSSTDVSAAAAAKMAIAAAPAATAEAAPAATAEAEAEAPAATAGAVPIANLRIHDNNAANNTASSPASNPANDDTLSALMLAFLDGAGIAPRSGVTSTQMLAPMPLTPAWMRHVGELLRASVEGALALLHSRSTVKREMRAEVTVIARRQNNPLKFAPDARAALAHLIAAKRSPGFLEPVAALKDAHEDLLVHHLAVVAGMRAAMFELIARLGPDDVLRDEGQPKGLAATLPTLHEAALWRRYCQRHAEMTASLDDDFETLFGREFTKAYEAQARRVREQAPPEGTGAGSGSGTGA